MFRGKAKRMAGTGPLLCDRFYVDLLFWLNIVFSGG